MLCAIRKPTGEVVIANSRVKASGPFVCPECTEEVVLRNGSIRVSHFAHKRPNDCDYGAGETEAHRRCKLEIYEALCGQPNVTDVALERSLKTVRPDVSAVINGVPVAIEVQISVLSQEAIIHRTKEYERKGFYVLWLAQWSPYLDGVRYSPRLWEKWVHAAYFGRVYYWVKGLKVAAYRFEPHLNHIPEMSWVSETGARVTAGGYTRRSKRWRVPIRVEILDLVKDFTAKQREWWKGGQLSIPFAKLFVQKVSHFTARY